MKFLLTVSVALYYTRLSSFDDHGEKNCCFRFLHDSPLQFKKKNKVYYLLLTNVLKCFGYIYSS
jgi:hypothetical protein